MVTSFVMYQDKKDVLTKGMFVMNNAIINYPIFDKNRQIIPVTRNPKNIRETKMKYTIAWRRKIILSI